MKRRIGKRLTVLFAALAMLGMMPGLASANVPPGKGLTTLECDEVGTVAVTRGGGGPGWVAADHQPHGAVRGEFTFTQGKKTGLLGETATCSFAEGPFSAVVTVVRVR